MSDSVGFFKRGTNGLGRFVWSFHWYAITGAVKETEKLGRDRKPTHLCYSSKVESCSAADHNAIGLYSFDELSLLQRALSQKKAPGKTVRKRDTPCIKT